MAVHTAAGGITAATDAAGRSTGLHVPDGLLCLARLVPAMTDCTYCGCDTTAHEPVYVEEVTDCDRVPAGQFCNYGCLVAHVESAGLVAGTACRLG